MQAVMPVMFRLFITISRDAMSTDIRFSPSISPKEVSFTGSVLSFVVACETFSSISRQPFQLFLPVRCFPPPPFPFTLSLDCATNLSAGISIFTLQNLRGCGIIPCIALFLLSGRSSPHPSRLPRHPEVYQRRDETEQGELHP